MHSTKRKKKKKCRSAFGLAVRGLVRIVQFGTGPKDFAEIGLWILTNGVPRLLKRSIPHPRIAYFGLKGLSAKVLEPHSLDQKI